MNERRKKKKATKWVTSGQEYPLSPAAKQRIGFGRSAGISKQGGGGKGGAPFLHLRLNKPDAWKRNKEERSGRNIARFRADSQSNLNLADLLGQPCAATIKREFGHWTVSRNCGHKRSS